jgi:hypothetical protein
MLVDMGELELRKAKLRTAQFATNATKDQHEGQHSPLDESISITQAR